MNPRATRRGLGAAGVVLLLAGIVASVSVVRIPDGSLGAVGRREAGGARLLPPGIHFCVPVLDRWAIVPAAPMEVEGRSRWTTPEGAAIDLPYRFRLDPSQASPDRILDAAPEGDLAAAARRAVEAALRPSPSATASGEATSTTGDLARVRITAVLRSLGLVEGSLVIEPAAPRPVATRSTGILDLLRASYRGPRHPVLLIGLDGADWAVMGPMIDRGDLPALASLRKRGAWSVLRSYAPTLSPLLWTTVATGKTPDQHGIVDFLAQDPHSGRQVPISSGLRRVRALWSILTDLGQRSLTVGWWATWPAEKVEGEMISDRISFSLLKTDAGESVESATWPPSLAARMARLRVRPEEISIAEMRRIVGLSDEEHARARASLKSESSWNDPVAHLMRVLAATRSYHAMALDRIRAGQPPLALVYYEGVDEVSHRFAHYAEPAMRWADPAKVPAFRDAVPNFYRLQDEMVGELLAAVSADTVVLLISDHGFAWGDRRPTDVPPDIEGKPGRWHTLEGVILAAGPTVKAGRLPRDPGLLDIAPTVLALLSLPAASDMPGRAIAEIASRGTVPGPDPPSIATYEPPSRSAPAGGPESSPVDEEMIAKLTALGYIGGGTARPTERAPSPAGGGAAGGAPGTVTGHVNAANVLLAKGDHAGAEPEYRKALALAPSFVPARLGLAQCLILADAPSRSEEGWREMEAILREGEDFDATIYMKVARFYRGRGKAAEGAAIFADLPRRRELEAARLTASALLLRAAGDEAGAERDLRAALREDPAFDDGLQEMYRLLTARGAIEDLVPILEDAVRARPGGVLASNLLALTYERAGRVDEAVVLLGRILETSPRDVATLTNLAGVYIRSDRPEQAIPHLEKAREVDPGGTATLVNLIVAQGRAGDLAGARRTFASAGDATSRIDVLNAMAYACYLGGDLSGARGLVESSLGRRPDQPEALRLRAAIEAALAGDRPPPVSGPGPGL